MTEQKTVIIACRGAAALSLEQLMPFQGNLKTLPEENYRKLRDEMLRDGFSEPISIWQEPVDGGDGVYRYHILNGHQRVTALKRMRDHEGFLVPDLPVSFVEAGDVRTAKRKVLALTSQFGVMTLDSVREFATEAQLGFADISDSFRFSEVDLSKLQPVAPKKVEFTAKDGAKELSEDEFQKFDHTCPRCAFSYNDDK